MGWSNQWFNNNSNKNRAISSSRMFRIQGVMAFWLWWLLVYTANETSINSLWKYALSYLTLMSFGSNINKKNFKKSESVFSRGCHLFFKHVDSLHCPAGSLCHSYPGIYPAQLVALLSALWLDPQLPHLEMGSPGLSVPWCHSPLVHLNVLC